MLHGRLALMNLEVCALQLASFCGETSRWKILLADWRRRGGRHTRYRGENVKRNPTQRIDLNLAARGKKVRKLASMNFKLRKKVIQLEVYRNANNVDG